MVFMLLEGLLTMLIKIFVGGGEDMVGAGQIVRRNAENVVAWLEVLVAQLQDHVGQMFSRQMVLPLYIFFPFDMLVHIWVHVFRLLENSFSVSMQIIFPCFIVF